MTVMEQQIPFNATPPQQQQQPEKAPTPFDDLPEPLREAGQMASDAFKEFKDSDAYEQILEAKDKAHNYITDNPMQSFFIALGLGTVLGFLLKRK